MSHFKVTIKEDKSYELYNKNDNTTRTYKTKGNCMKQLRKSLDKETAKLVMEGKFVGEDSDDELDREIEVVRLKQIEMEKKIEKRKILKMEKERLLKMENDYKEMENSFPLMEKKWKKNGKEMEKSFPLVEEIFPKVENNFSIRDIDLVPNIESPTMTITRPLKMLMPTIPLDDIPTINLEEIKSSNLYESKKEYDLDKIKVLLHLLVLKKFNKI